MKSKKEEKLPEQGCDTKMSAENAATNEVVNNETVQEEASEEEDEESMEQEEGEMEFHASKKDFLLFMHKMLRLMKDVVFLNHSLHEFEKDPIFDMLLDLSKVHLKEMNESSKAQESSDDSDNEESGDDDDDTITETFISMKVRRLKD